MKRAVRGSVEATRHFAQLLLIEKPFSELGRYLDDSVGKQEVVNKVRHTCGMDKQVHNFTTK